MFTLKKDACGGDILLFLMKLGEPIHSKLNPVLLLHTVVVDMANGVDFNLALGGGVTGTEFVS